MCKALDKYPSNMVRKNLRFVYIVKKLSYLGIEAAGTHSNNSIYIANDGRSNGYTDIFLEK